MRNQVLNLRLTQQTMTRVDTWDFVDGQAALRMLAELDRNPFSVNVRLVNRTAIGNEEVEVPVTLPSGEVSMARAIQPVYSEVLVWESVDVMPRWVTAPQRAADREARAALQAALQDGPHEHGEDTL